MPSAPTATTDPAEPGGANGVIALPQNPWFIFSYIEARHFPLNNLLVLVLCTKPPQILRPSPAPVQATVVQLPPPWLSQVHGLVTTATLLPVSDHYRRIFDLIFPILIDHVLILTPYLVLLKGTLQ